MKLISNLSRNTLVLAAAATLAASASSFAGQGHMEAALSDLRAARQQLVIANHDKGGWRVEAIRNLDAVIAQVENGMAAASHGH
jgi:hypothetical protein